MPTGTPSVERREIGTAGPTAITSGDAPSRRARRPAASSPARADGASTVTACPSARSSCATPATCSFTSCGCDHANGVTRQIFTGPSLVRVEAVTEVTIKTRENGPYLVTGPFTLTDADGNVFELPAGSAVALCRCGHSATKPFCDASHKRVDFVARERAGGLDVE